MSPEANKRVVGRYIEMWNTGEVAIADEVLAPTWVDHIHPEVTGPASVKQAITQIRTAFPHFAITVEDVVGEGNVVAVRAIVHREEATQVMWFVRLVDGKMTELWTGIATSR